MNINSSMKNYERGKIVQAAHAVLDIYIQNERGVDPVPMVLEKQLDEELLRLINNEIQLRNSWGELIQLCMLIVLLTEGYVPCLKE